jgi:glutathione synthase
MSTKKSAANVFKIGFLMDPIEDINLDTDTTFVLMLEAQRRGSEVYYLKPGDLRVEYNGPASIMRKVTVKRPASKKTSHFKLGKKFDKPLSSLDLIFNRIDPPYSIEYVTKCQILGMVPSPTVVVNRPGGVLLSNEKLLAMRFPKYMPETIVTHDKKRILDFMDKINAKIVVKPLESFGGTGVFVVGKNDTNKSVIIETMTENGTKQVVAQKFLPVLKKGDKRIIMLAGEPIGAVLRYPAKGDHRSNLHSGGSAVKTSISQREMEICEAVKPLLKKEGLFLAGLDVVAGYLTEINVTSPTLVKQINETQNIRLEERIMDFFEYLSVSSKSRPGR